MVSVDTTLAALNGYMKKPLSVEKLEQSLFELGFELDEKDPSALKIDVTADRPDMVSAAGVARVLNAYLGHAKGFPVVEKKPSSYLVNVEKTVQGVRPYTAAMVVKNIRLSPEKLDELIYVQEKMHATFARDRKKAAIGIYPLKKIQWPITFRGELPHEIRFAPLGSETPMQGNAILDQHPTGKKYAHLLRDLPVYPVFRDKSGNVLSMPPIINSHSVGQVSPSDTELFVEVSGHYWPTVSTILDILAYLFSDMGGDILEVNVQFHNETSPRSTPELGMVSHSLPVELVNQTLGTSFTTTQISELLSRMLYRTTKSNPTQLVVETPAFRADILHPADVVDDVARAYGFHNLVPLPVQVATRGGILPQTQRNADARLALVGLGFQEVMSWLLTSHEHHFTAFEREETPHLKLGTTKEQGLTMVRNMLFPETLRALLANRSKRSPFKLFELDQVVEVDSRSETGSRSRYKLAMVLGHASASFDEMKGYVESLATQMGAPATFSAEPVHGFLEDRTFIKGRFARVKMGPHSGFMGEIHPRICSKLGVPFTLLVAEFDLE